MKLEIKVRTGAARDKILQTKDGILDIWVKAKPKHGEANAAVVEVLAHYFKVPAQKIKIIFGKRSRKKIVDISQ